MEKNFKKTTPANQNWWQPGLLMFARLSAWIVAPVLLGALVGKWLDNKFNTEPWIFFTATGTAFLISMFGLVKSATEEYRKIEKQEKKENNKSN